MGRAMPDRSRRMAGKEVQKMKTNWNDYYNMGSVCPCCQQQTIVYRREITFPMLHCMKVLYSRLKNKPSNYNEISNTHRVTTDFTKLRYWGLIQKTPESSLYKLTPDGIAFIRGYAELQRYRWIYNDERMPDPKDIDNPLIFCHDIKPKKMDKETILADSMTLSEYINHQKQSVDIFS